VHTRTDDGKISPKKLHKNPDQKWVKIKRKVRRVESFFDFL
jgi:hypothetical protein